MLFNSFPFLLVYLPIVLLGYYALVRARAGGAALTWLIVTSLAFYAYWKAPYVLLLLGSYVVNYLLAQRIGKTRSRALVAAGVAANVSLLVYYKYAHFFSVVAGTLVGVDFGVQQKLLPLAISFFTFQQIAYLVDVYRGAIPADTSPVRYALSITFFPHLIAGPIVNYKEIRAQLVDPVFPERDELASRLTIGFSIFMVGLFKKVVIADYFAESAKAFYEAVASGVQAGAVEAWLGTGSYTFQLYFDFSGYSDMAIGLSFLFGIVLPINFNSPYKATSIIDFWRRWHITLSRFLRDYLYIPLGGNRHGFAQQLRNVFFVMLVGGLWHGAGWTFVAWGAAHGTAICINHCYVKFRGWRPPAALAWLATLLFVHLGWVLFRSPDLGTAGRVFQALLDVHRIQLPRGLGALVEHRLGLAVEPGLIYTDSIGVLMLVACLALALAWVRLLPNLYELFAGSGAYLPVPGYELPGGTRQGPRLDRVGAIVGAAAGCAFAIAMMAMLSEAPSSFLYFNF